MSHAIDPNKTYRGNVVQALLNLATRQLAGELAELRRQRDAALDQLAKLRGNAAIANLPDIEFLAEEDRETAE